MSSRLACERLLELFGMVRGPRLDPFLATRRDWQQMLMERRQGTFEEIQRDAMFSRVALERLRALLPAWEAGGDAAASVIWERLFTDQPGEGWRTELPVRVTGGNGASEATAIQLLHTLDMETRVAAEWWFLRYSLPQGWQPRCHMSTRREQDGAEFSVHDVQLPDSTAIRVYFRKPPGEKYGPH